MISQDINNLITEISITVSADPKIRAAQKRQLDQQLSSSYLSKQIVDQQTQAAKAQKSNMMLQNAQKLEAKKEAMNSRIVNAQKRTKLGDISGV